MTEDNYNAVSKVFEYGNSNVRMRVLSARNVQVCVTDFAKAFPEKNLSHIVNSQEIQDYVREMSEIQNCISADLLQVTKGGNPSEQGTWANSKVALRIAQKLSTKFSIWVDEHIEELLTKGTTSVQQYRLPQTYSEALRELANQVEQNEQLKLENKQKDEVIEVQKPKVAFADAVLSSKDLISVAEMAKLLCQNGYRTGEIRFYQRLRDEGFLCTTGKDYNLPCQRYLEMGIFKVTEKPFADDYGVMRICRKTQVTTKGQQYFINRYCRQEPTLFGEEVMMSMQTTMA